MNLIFFGAKMSGNALIVDRVARDQILAALDDFLGGRILARKFEECIQTVESRDSTVPEVASELSFLYDDVDDNPVNLNIDGWNYAQRVRLLLMSDAVMTAQRRWRPMRYCFFLAAALSILAWALWQFGPSWESYLVYVVVGFALVRLRARPPRHLRRLHPFPSRATLRRVREATTGFRKLPIPGDLKSRPLPPEWMNWFGPGMTQLWFQVTFWPIIALIQLPLGLLRRKRIVSLNLPCDAAQTSTA